MFKKTFIIVSVAFLTACAQESSTPADAAGAAADEATQAASAAAGAVADAAGNAAGATAAGAAAVAEAAGAGIEARLASADAEKGKRFYIFCQACHSINAGGMNKVGPNLHGIVGRAAAEGEGFIYSEALQNSGLTWDAATLDEWIRRPAELVPGTTMVFAGIPDAQQRADLIAYITQASGQ